MRLLKSMRRASFRSLQRCWIYYSIDVRQQRQAIDSFFQEKSTVSLVPLSSLKESAPLDRKELAKLGRLAGLEVDNRDDKFAKSVAEVLEFCQTVRHAKSYQGYEHKDLDDSQIALEGPFEEGMEENLDKELLLKNAQEVREGLFVAPKTSVAENT